MLLADVTAGEQAAGGVEVRRRLFERASTPAGEHHERAGLGEGDRRGAPDPAAGAGDDHDAIVQPEIGAGARVVVVWSGCDAGVAGAVGLGSGCDAEAVVGVVEMSSRGLVIVVQGHCVQTRAPVGCAAGWTDRWEAPIRLASGSRGEGDRAVSPRPTRKIVASV
jgi:hypothetical protein